MFRFGLAHIQCANANAHVPFRSTGSHALRNVFIPRHPSTSGSVGSLRKRFWVKTSSLLSAIFRTNTIKDGLRFRHQSSPACGCGLMHAPMWVGCPPLGGGWVVGLLSEDLHQVVLRGRTIRKGCGMDTVGIVLDALTFGDDLEE